MITYSIDRSYLIVVDLFCVAEDHHRFLDVVDG